MTKERAAVVDDDDDDAVDDAVVFVEVRQLYPRHSSLTPSTILVLVEYISTSTNN
jgi:hypothetical protein